MRRFIDKDTGHCFPLGTASTFTTYFAPADFNETVNTLDSHFMQNKSQEDLIEELIYIRSQIHYQCATDQGH